MPHHNRSTQRTKKPEAPNPVDCYGYDNPQEAIRNFFSNFELEEINDLLYKFLRHWITSNDIVYLDSRGRDSVVFFYEQLRVLVKASYLLQKERIEKGGIVHHKMS